MNTVTVTVTSDFICPWCWIGHRNLRAAIEEAGLDKSQVEVKFAPFELNPTMPQGGLNRQEYRTRKFGSWARSQAMDAQVSMAGKRAGAAFNYEKVLVTPNTRLAHRLIRFAQDVQGSADKVEVLFEAIFQAYFSEGRDIGTLDVVLELAEKSGFDREAVRAYLVSNKGAADVKAAELQAQLAGVNSVPSFELNGERISGAQPPAHIAQLLKAAAAGEAAPAGV